jgi:ubiquinol oxidase
MHHAPSGFSDHFALAFTKVLRFFADTFLPSVMVIVPLF